MLNPLPSFFGIFCALWMTGLGDGTLSTRIKGSLALLLWPFLSQRERPWAQFALFVCSRRGISVIVTQGLSGFSADRLHNTFQSPDSLRTMVGERLVRRKSGFLSKQEGLIPPSGLSAAGCWMELKQECKGWTGCWLAYHQGWGPENTPGCCGPVLISCFLLPYCCPSLLCPDPQPRFSGPSLHLVFPHPPDEANPYWPFPVSLLIIATTCPAQR